MALSNLASTADLSARGVTGSNERLTLALTVASSVIREAAGSAISAVVGTVTVPAPRGKLLTLPSPVRSVTAVVVDGAEVDDWYEVGNGLYREHGWAAMPVPVTVSATFGLAVVPADIVDLTCNLAKAWLDHTDGGGGSVAGLTMVAIDDARESYTDEAAGQVSPVFLPAATREWLAARFGGGAQVMETL